MPLKWTTEPPTVPGWYWHRNCLGVTFLHLTAVKANPLPALDTWEWAGPVPEPEESEPPRGKEEEECTR